MNSEDDWHSDVSTAKRSVPGRMFFQSRYRTTPDELPYYAGCFCVGSQSLASAENGRRTPRFDDCPSLQSPRLQRFQTYCLENKGDCLKKSLQQDSDPSRRSAASPVLLPPEVTDGTAGAPAAGGRPGEGSAQRENRSRRHCGRGAASAPDTPVPRHAAPT
jgi:hypothetical protein